MTRVVPNIAHTISIAQDSHHLGRYSSKRFLRFHTTGFSRVLLQFQPNVLFLKFVKKRAHPAKERAGENSCIAYAESVR